MHTKPINTRMLTILLLLFFCSLTGGEKIKAQDPFSSIKIGATAFAELIEHPAFPESELVVVQFCGPRLACGSTEFYTKQLRDRGFDIGFAAVYDTVMSKTSNRRLEHENAINTRWGGHFFKAAAHQVYILDGSRTVIYQGFMPNNEAGVLSMVSEGVASYHDVQALIDERAEEFINRSPGVWYYQGHLLPLRLQLGRFVEMNQLTTTTLSQENDVRLLKTVDYVPGKVMESLLQALGLSATISFPTEEEAYITVSIE